MLTILLHTHSDGHLHPFTSIQGQSVCLHVCLFSFDKGQMSIRRLQNRAVIFYPFIYPEFNQLVTYRQDRDHTLFLFYKKPLYKKPGLRRLKI